MSTKTFFKRIALVVVTALSFGALASAPSYSDVSSATTSVTLSASSGSVVAAETSTAITITVQFTPTGTSADTVTVIVVPPSSPTPVTNNSTTGSTLRITTDSSNATIAFPAGTAFAGATDSATVTITPTTANGVTRAVFTYTVRSAANVGVFGYTVQARKGDSQAILQSALYTLTVTGADASASPLKSNLYINKVLPSGSTYIMADSALVVSAGQQPNLSLMTPNIVGYAMGNFRNAAGDSVVATNSSTNVDGTMVVKITSGPGFLSRYETATATQLVRQISIVRGDSIVIWNDGAAGVGVITTYIGTTPLSDPADTVTFFGKAQTLVATANAVTANGWNLTAGSDSDVSGTAILTFTAKDSAGIAVPSASQNRNSKLFLHSSDTTVVRGEQSATLGYGECTAPATAADQTAGKWTCDMYVIDSGTVTLTVSDSMTIASSLYTSNAISVTVAGAAYKGAFSFAKTAVQTGENVLMTITCEDRAGRACGQPTTAAVGYSTLFNSGGTQTKQFIGGATTGSGVSTGTATFSTVYQWAAGAVFFGGTETALVTMPLTTGDVVIELTTGGTDALVVPKVTLVVSNASVDAATAAANAATAAANAASAAAVAAAKAAQDAAVAEAQAAFDAATEAIDAATAATDAANLAAEAADAATVAAEEARDAADAATAAVEELATQVASLMAALRAQITTLANTVVKIAKKVKA